MKTSNTTSTIDRIAMQAVIVAAKTCQDAVLADDLVLLYRASERLRVAVSAVSKGQPSHSRMARTARDVWSKWQSVYNSVCTGMAMENKVPPRLDEAADSREFRAFTRVVERASSC